MRKAVSILFLWLYLCSFTEFYQALKFPMLVSHYFEHKAEDPAVSLLQFIKMHYGQQSAPDADWQQDMQLPFKSHSENLSLSVSNYPPAVASLAVGKTAELRAIVMIPREQNFIPRIACTRIFQPPRTI